MISVGLAKRMKTTWWLLLLLVPCSWSWADDRVEVDSDRSTARCRHGVVVSVSGPASDVGLAVLKDGGNAVDSAIATAFVLAVTHPAAGNIGGGGYMLVVPAANDPLVIDFREVAPGDATRDMFVDPAGRTPHRRVGVPGTVRGLALAHTRLGRLPWRRLVQPAIDLAAQGSLLEGATAKSLNELLESSDKSIFSELHRVFGKPDGAAWMTGDRLTQPDLARTLQRIAERGADGFYLGETAEKFVAEIKRGEGLITAADLAAYRPLPRQPLRGTYRGYEIITVPPSSSGGTTLIETLNILESFTLDPKRDAVMNVHRMAEAMRRAFRDRAQFLGDPEVTPVPSLLYEKDHARELAKSITGKATASRDLSGEIKLTLEGEHTTHLSVVDQERMAVSLTYTLESSYGSKVVVAGAGFLLNDEMNDFNWLPGVTNDQGRIGTDPNLIRPGRRMLSSMCPTMVARDGKVVLVTGSPGGRTIISTVLCVVTNVVDFKVDVRAAVDAPRLHHGWFPDVIRMESEWVDKSPELVKELQNLGHTVVSSKPQGDAHSIWIDQTNGELVGVADKRDYGKASGY